MKESTLKSRDLIARLQVDPAFASIDFATEMQPDRYVGRAPEQVDEFIALEVDPIRKRYGGMGMSEEISV